MDLLSTPEQIQAALDHFDQLEQEMQRNLAHLAVAGPEHAYHTYARACVRMRAQNASRVKFLKGWKKQLE